MGWSDVLDAKRRKRFEKLPKEWVEEKLSASDDDLKEVIRSCAMNNVALNEAKKCDEDLISLKAQVATAEHPYKAGTAQNSIKIEFAMETLKSRGQPVPNIDDFLRGEASEGDE